MGARRGLENGFVSELFRFEGVSFRFGTNGRKGKSRWRRRGRKNIGGI